MEALKLELEKLERQIAETNDNLKLLKKMARKLRAAEELNSQLTYEGDTPRT
jgi:phage shock protein A